MHVYTYSEARQKLSIILDQAESMGKVLIRRKDGRTFALICEKATASPLDVPTIKAKIITKEMVDIIREGTRAAYRIRLVAHRQDETILNV